MRGKKEQLVVEESKWRKKIRAIWIREGDNNTKFFHNYARYRRITNSIWEINNMEGRKVTSSGYIAEACKSLFFNLLKQLARCPILEIINVIYLFPCSISTEMNDFLLAEISNKEIFAPLSSF